MALFSNFALKAIYQGEPYQYLGVVVDVGDHKGYIAYTTDAVLSPCAKFAVEYAHDGLVHIRSCVNNKYWARSSTEGEWIVANGTEAVNDEKSWNCTLFKVVKYQDDVYDLGSNDDEDDKVGKKDDDNCKVTFVHVQSGRTIIRKNEYLSIDDPYLLDTKFLPDNNFEVVAFVVIDYDSFVILPKYVAFKANNERFYDNDLGGFISDDVNKETVLCEIETMNDGNIRIKRPKLDENGRQLYWTYLDAPGSQNAVANFWDEPGKKNNLFWVEKVSKNVVALRNIGSGLFCILPKKSPEYTYDDFFLENAVMICEATTTVKETWFTVMQPVHSRRVRVLEFDFDNSRVYNRIPLSSQKATFDNPTDREAEATLDLSISTTATTTWTNTVSVTGTVETSFTAKYIFLAEGKITVSASATYEHVWQGSESKTQTLGTKYTFKVPSKKRVVAIGMATQGTCDVPFKYVQMDRLSNGETFKQVFDDGVFTGVNGYDFHYKVQNFDLDDTTTETSLVPVKDISKKNAGQTGESEATS